MNKIYNVWRRVREILNTEQTMEHNEIEERHCVCLGYLGQQHKFGYGKRMVNY